MSIAERKAPPVGALFWARRSFGYAGLTLDRGQVFKLVGAPNDRLLVDLGYCQEVTEDMTKFPCRKCGVEFIDQGLREGHGRERHESRPFVPPPAPVRGPDESSDTYKNRLDAWAQQAGSMADAHAERKDKLEDEVAPLDLTKTTASRS